MANPYYTFDPDFVPGTKARAGEVNTQFLALEAAFDYLPAIPAGTTRGVNTLGVESGSGNTYVVTMPDTRLSNLEGDTVYFKATHSNTGAVTLNVDGIGAVAARGFDDVAFSGGEIVSGRYYGFRYNNALARFQLTEGNDASNKVAYAAEWANKAHGSLVSVAAGGDGVDDYSAMHWAEEAATSALSIGANNVSFRGNHDASGNTAPTTPADRAVYRISVAGTFSGIVWGVNDYAMYNGTTWERVSRQASAAFTVAGTFAVPTVSLSSATPTLMFNETDAAADEKYWDLRATGGDLILSTVSDALSGTEVVFAVLRTGINVDAFLLTADLISLNGVSVADYARLSQANTFLAAQTISAAAPELLFTETDASADNRHWSFRANAEVFFGTIYDNAFSGNNWLAVNRTGSTVDSIDVVATTITLNGVDIADYPRLSQSNTFTGATNYLSGTSPILYWVETGVTADNGKWRVYADGESFNMTAVNDAQSVEAGFLAVQRTGTTVDSVTLFGTTIALSGAASLGAATITGAAAFTLAASGLTFPVTMSSTLPGFLLSETDAAADNKHWRFYVNSEQLFFDLANDAAAGSTWLAVNRTGITVDSIALAATTITLNSVSAADFARLSQNNVFTGSSQRISASTAQLALGASGSTTGRRNFDIASFSDALFIRLLADDFASSLGTIYAYDVLTGAHTFTGSILSTGALTVSTSHVSASEVGYQGIPINEQTADYQVVSSDNGKTIYASTACDQVTNIANSSAFDGFCYTVIANGGAPCVLVQGTGNTFYLAGTGFATTGNRTVAVGGEATVKRFGSGSWLVGGPGVT